jgi:hypothetical protein
MEGCCALLRLRAELLLPDLLELRCDGRRRVVALAIGSLGCAGFASGAAPDWASMRPMRTP